MAKKFQKKNLSGKLLQDKPDTVSPELVEANQVDQVKSKNQEGNKSKRKQSQLPGGIKRFTSYLKESDISRLKEVSEATRIPMTELVSKAVSEYLKATWTDAKIQQVKKQLDDLL